MSQGTALLNIQGTAMFMIGWRPGCGRALAAGIPPLSVCAAGASFPSHPTVPALGFQVGDSRNASMAGKPQ